jgi:putative transposase
MIEPNLSGLSVSTQCALLSISRSSFYYEPKGETEMNLDLMRLIHCPASLNAVSMRGDMQLP